MDVTVAPDTSCGVGRRLSGGNNAAGTVASSGAPRVRSGQDLQAEHPTKVACGVVRLDQIHMAVEIFAV
jgi:hypothetical protein